LIDENTRFLQPNQIEAHVAALNRAGDQSLSFEWEIVLLNCLSKLGDVRHEPPLGGRTKLDVLFRSRRELAHGFAADIATVYEGGREERNPLHMIEEALLRRVRKAGLDPDRFGIRAEGELRGGKGRRVMDLKLPPRKDIESLFDAEFKAFLASCKVEAGVPHEFKRNSSEVEIEISYDPARPYFSMSYPSFDVAYSATRNPIFNAMVRKADQLRDANAPPPYGVMLCGADVRLRPSRMGSSIETYDAPKIIQHFLKQKPWIAFVLAIESDDTPYRFGAPLRTEISSWLYLQEATPSEIVQETLRCLEAIQKLVPPPVNSGTNALNYLRGKRPREGQSFYGSLQMTESTIRISSRGLVELLAGRVSQEAFLRRHSFGNGQPSTFEIMLRRGKTLVGVEIQKEADRDDDWLIFHFAPPDPAITKFRADAMREDPKGRSSD
jgi:hypothetical protein